MKPEHAAPRVREMHELPEAERLAAIQRLTDGATKPPWRWMPTSGDIWGGGDEKTIVAKGVWPHDAELMAVAREDVPWLLGLIRDRDAELTRLRSLLGRAADTAGETLQIVDDCYKATGHIKVAHSSHQRERILAVLSECRAASQGSDAD